MKTTILKYIQSLVSTAVYFTLIPLLWSCQDVIDVQLDTGETLLVVDGWITNQNQTCTVKLTQTKPYFANTPATAVAGAALQLTDNEGNTENLTETAPGIYKIQTIKGKVGNQYTLKIISQGETYEAKTEIKNVPPIDSLTYRFKEERSDLKEGIYVRYFGPELPTLGDYFRVKVYKNDIQYNKPSELIISSDEFINGNYIGDLEFDFGDPFKVNDKIKVELLSLPEDAYYFLQEMITQVNNGGLFGTPPANVRTNVRNLNPSSKKKALGYFGGSAVSTIQGTIIQKEGVIK
jgi:hypothetical protein